MYEQSATFAVAHLIPNEETMSVEDAIQQLLYFP
jgi:hypothetical protein